ncbi:hypothetical protein AYO22_01967 [Fonsecaea multimorphosa]|nr:hypothetical protein AYO22_01967 [Fonsecaea multimorphosa]
MNNIMSFLDITPSSLSSFSSPEQSTPSMFARSPPMPSLTALAPTSNNGTTATSTSNGEALSLESWMSTFTTAGYHSFLQKIYDWEAWSWYYILYYQEDIPYSNLSHEGRHFVKTLKAQNSLLPYRIIVPTASTSANPMAPRRSTTSNGTRATGKSSTYREPQLFSLEYSKEIKQLDRAEIESDLKAIKHAILLEDARHIQQLDKAIANAMRAGEQRPNN